MLTKPVLTQDDLLTVTATIEIGGRSASSKQVGRELRRLLWGAIHFSCCLLFLSMAKIFLSTTKIKYVVMNYRHPPNQSSANDPYCWLLSWMSRCTAGKPAGGNKF